MLDPEHQAAIRCLKWQPLSRATLLMDVVAELDAILTGQSALIVECLQDSGGRPTPVAAPREVLITGVGTDGQLTRSPCIVLKLADEPDLMLVEISDVPGLYLVNADLGTAQLFWHDVELTSHTIALHVLMSRPLDPFAPGASHPAFA